LRTESRTAVVLASGAALTIAGGVTAVTFAAHHGPARARNAAVTHVTSARPPLRVASVTPADGSHGVNGAEPVTVTFNQPLPARAPFPRLSPAVAGTWDRSGNKAVFTPASGFPGDTSVSVTMPATGSQPAAGEPATGKPATVKPATGKPATGPAAVKPTARVTKFTTARYSTLRLQQLLAELGYLPMTWSAYLGGTVTPGSMPAQAAAAYNPPDGSFSWKHGYPSEMYGLWRQGKPNPLQAGAIAGFEADHGLRVDGNAGSALWAALLKAAAAGQHDSSGYSYAIVSKSMPETLTIWHDGHRVFSSAANTGISSRPTVSGTFFVYEKLAFQVMQGTNPDGSHYSDPVQWVSYFNGGDAVHYFPRGSFGWPQSLGCVELPYDAAERSYHYLPYGTVVSVHS
jgi:peptidoglycan hydrolase-like protein with peptidoglycan-binding domain